MTIRQLPVSPSRDRPAQFSQEMDAMLAALPGFVDDANALEQSLQLVSTTGTSASTLTIGTGTKTLTTQPGKAWVTGAWVYVFCASAVTNLMVGQVVSYNSETGVLQINSQQVDGGGTFNSWVIGLSVPQSSGMLDLVNGALQKAGGAMVGPLALQANASNPLHAVPKQQAESIASGYAQVSSALSFSSLSVSATGLNSNVSVSANEVLLRNSSGAPQLLSNIALTINCAASGANGVDTGALAANTWYAVHVIWNGTNAAGLISLSQSAPTLPAGYTHRARVGWIRTDGTNKFPLGFTQKGRQAQYLVNSSGNVQNFPQMASGAVGDTSAPSFVTVSTSAFVPATASVIDVLARIGNNSSVVVAPNGQFGGVNSSTNPAPISLIVNSMTYGGVTRGSMVLESSNLYWACVGGGVLSCIGWEDNL